MKVRLAILLLSLVTLALSDGIWASQEHGHGDTGNHHDHADHDSHDHHQHEEKKPDHREHGQARQHDNHSQADGHAHSSTGGVGPNNAVTAADEHDGIKLSQKAIQVIGLKTQVVSNTKVPESAVVFYQNHVGVYRLRNNWYRLISVTGNKLDGFYLPNHEIQNGDQIVIAGAALLRVAELDAFSGEVGHEH